MERISNFFKSLFRRPTKRQVEPVDTALLNYLDGLENIRPEPGDEHDVLLNKAARLIQNHCEFYAYNIPPPHTSLDVARHLESLNARIPAADPAFSLVLELLLAVSST